MNRGLLLKSLVDARAVTVLLAVAMLLAEGVLSYVLPTVMEDFSSQLLQVPFFRSVISALLGADIGDTLVPATFIAIAWVHPVVLAILWTHAIVFCTRVPAGEIDRGTIDVLLSLPVSRWQVYVAETIVFLATGLAVVTMGMVGHRLGIMSLASEDRPGLGRMLVIAANLYCLYMAVGGLGFLVSAVSNRRGRAIATVFGILLASFLLNFLAQFWEPAQFISFLGILDYYRPVLVLQGLASPVGDIVVLLIFGAVMWAAGGFIFARRNICTV